MRHEPLERAPARRPPAPAPPAPGRATALMRMQRSAGNRAVAMLLQRQDDEDAAADVVVDLLDAKQVAAAIRFYKNQPKQYTADIVNQIQAAVGVTETGVADEDTVQAVARWQAIQGDADPALKVDGKAGPRTLPRMFAHGLNAEGEGQAFGEEAQAGVVDRWGELTPAERAAELVRLVNVHLQSAGVPPVIPNPKDTGNDAGSFEFSTWQMNIGLKALAADTLSRDEAAAIVDTIYHEARHAEQWFRMAQLRAGEGRSAAAIAKELQIPANIATLAKDAKLDPASMQGLIARGWYENVYGSGSDRRDATLDEVENAATALKKARERLEKNPTPGNQAKVDAAAQRFHRAHDAYRDLPEENDAWATGPMTGAGVTQGSPAPPAKAGALEGALKDLVGAAK